jgi:DNA replication and repair protein RecF
MALDRITLTRFRNHSATRIEGTAHFNLLVGDNGAGKTNVLEALSLFAPGRGLRRAALPEMADKDGGGGFGVSAALAQAAGEPVQLGTGTDPARPRRRLVHVNGAEASAVSLAEWLSLSWLTPAMDRLFADSAGARRRYLDRLALALDPAHARHAARYEAALRERNRLLAEDAEPEARWFDAIEAQMAEAGTALALGRADLVGRLASTLAALPERPFAHPELRYEPGAPLDGDSLRAELARSRPRDRAARRSLVGPHRDELLVTMAGKRVAGGAMPAAECSTGEQKAMLIAITLAHAGLAAGPRPALLLLDEVAAHLDPVRRAALFERLRDSGAQVWLTGTEHAPFGEIAGEAAVWRVSGGTVERREA